MEIFINQKMAGSAMLFACTKCHSRHKFDELSKEEQLCKDCRRKYPLSSCVYCQLEFHILKKIDGQNVCGKCAHGLHTHGKPSNCKYCNVKAAFKDKCCTRCSSSEKKYGPPVKCQMCSLVCAFKKPQETQAKVNGQILCLKCTFKFKKDRYKQQRLSRHDHNLSKDDIDFGSSTANKKVIAPLKSENIAKSLYKHKTSLSERTSIHGSENRHENNNTTLEPTFGDHMTELTSLREQIIKLKKVTSQKEKIILEKDKKINELQAEQWEKDKLLKSRVQSVQKEYEGRIESLQMENQSLRKQVKDLLKTKKNPKVERMTSHIRLEPHKISLTPTSNRSPTHTPRKTPDNDETNTGTESQTENEDGIDFNTDLKEDQRKNNDTERKEAAESDSESEKDSSRRKKSFDEAQEEEIKRVLQEENDIRSGADKKKRGKKRKHKKHKSKLSVEDDDDQSTGNEQDDNGPSSRKRKPRKSKAILEDSDDEEYEARSPRVRSQENTPRITDDDEQPDEDDTVSPLNREEDDVDDGESGEEQNDKRMSENDEDRMNVDEQENEETIENQVDEEEKGVSIEDSSEDTSDED